MEKGNFTFLSHFLQMLEMLVSLKTNKHNILHLRKQKYKFMLYLCLEIF